MKVTITLHYSHCQSAKIKKNGKKNSKKQNYFYKDCGRQFIGNHALTYKACHCLTLSIPERTNYGKRACSEIIRLIFQL